MKIKCPRCQNQHKKFSKNGRFKRKSDSKTVQRFICKVCFKSFSYATFSECKDQKKRGLNYPIKIALCSSASIRRIALVHKISRNTVKRKLEFLSFKAQKNHSKFLESKIFKKIQFDDLESFEHTKLKPITVSMLVEEQTRKIIGFKVSQIGAKGLLVHKSKKLYGKRKNESFCARKELFRTLQKNISQTAVFKTDEHTQYAKLIKEFFPKSLHKRYKSQRGSIFGQGELKRVAFDPLFSVNHTFAMLRANINRLVRRTWCTTKKMKCLEMHLWVYVDFHNSVLT